MTQRWNVASFCLLILLVQFNFQSFTSYLKSVHFLDSFLSWSWAFKTHKADTFAFSIFLSHYSGAENSSEFFEELMKLRVFHVVGQMEQEKIASWRSKFPLRVLHIIESINLLLNVPIAGIIGVKDFGPWRWSIELWLSGSIVVVIMLILMINLMINVLNRVGERIEILRSVFLAHEGIVLSLLEPYFNWDSTSMQISLPVEIFYR